MPKPTHCNHGRLVSNPLGPTRRRRRQSSSRDGYSAVRPACVQCSGAGFPRIARRGIAAGCRRGAPPLRRRRVETAGPAAGGGAQRGAVGAALCLALAGDQACIQGGLQMWPVSGIRPGGFGSMAMPWRAEAGQACALFPQD